MRTTWARPRFGPSRALTLRERRRVDGEELVRRAERLTWLLRREAELEEGVRLARSRTLRPTEIRPGGIQRLEVSDPLARARSVSDPSTGGLTYDDGWATSDLLSEPADPEEVTVVPYSGRDVTPPYREDSPDHVETDRIDARIPTPPHGRPARPAPTTWERWTSGLASLVRAGAPRTLDND